MYYVLHGNIATTLTGNFLKNLVAPAPKNCKLCVLTVAVHLILQVLSKPFRMYRFCFSNHGCDLMECSEQMRIFLSYLIPGATIHPSGHFPYFICHAFTLFLPDLFFDTCPSNEFSEHN